MHPDQRIACRSRIPPEALADVMQVLGLLTGAPEQPEKRKRREHEEEPGVNETLNAHARAREASSSSRSAPMTSATEGASAWPQTLRTRGEPYNPVAAGLVET